MTRMTEETDKEFIIGEKKKHHWAKAILPLLVRQADKKECITYSDLLKLVNPYLPDELEIKNPRNFNYPLGTIGEALVRLGKETGRDIPPIQILVVNKNQGVPGSGIGRFRLKINEYEYQRIYTFGDWQWVLQHFGLTPLSADREKLPN
jgi:hypothetical protein